MNIFSCSLPVKIRKWIPDNQHYMFIYILFDLELIFVEVSYCEKREKEISSEYK